VSDKTRDRILDAAEQHFAASGFAGATLRGIIRTARVNVAAVAYHFGAKDDLYAAVIERFAAPVVERQLAALRLVDGPRPDAEAVLRAFFAPPLELVAGVGKKGRTLSLFLGRIQAEVEPVADLVDRHFAACRDAFVAALARALPHRPAAAHQWHFELMVGSIVCFLTRGALIRRRIAAPAEWKAEPAVEMLVGFALNGIAGGRRGR
jgi:AcrR family transcriptional regulator